MSSSDITEAMAYSKIEPWGEWRDDYRAALVASVTANCHAGSSSKRFKVSDFMPEFEVKTEAERLSENIKEVLNIGNSG